VTAAGGPPPKNGHKAAGEKNKKAEMAWTGLSLGVMAAWRASRLPPTFPRRALELGFAPGSRFSVFAPRIRLRAWRLFFRVCAGKQPLL
jgi:hypothetical protein